MENPNVMSKGHNAQILSWHLPEDAFIPSCYTPLGSSIIFIRSPLQQDMILRVVPPTPARALTLL